jgi:chorismate dehydratase
MSDYPSRLAQRLMDDEIDIGLIPVAVLPKLKDYYIIGDYCIGAEGEIASVALFSEVPLQEIRKVYLDYQSRTSVALLKFLMKEYWGINPTTVQATDEGYRDKIKGTTAGLVIGDRAFEQRRVSTFIYDLGSEWKAITGLPFVFAAWVSLKPVPDEFVSMFNAANGLGLKNIDLILRNTSLDTFDLRKYYSMHLSYELDDRKRQGMKVFLEKIAELQDDQITIPE